MTPMHPACPHGRDAHNCGECADEWYRWLWNIKLALLRAAGDGGKEKR